MSYSSDLTKERILECAKEEFLCNGFSQANIREIAANAKVTTGALYNHFKNKEILFDALVGQVAKELYELYETEHKKCASMTSYMDQTTQEIFTKAISEILEYLYQHFAEASLLFFHSVGTKYENFKDHLIDIEEKSTLAMLSQEGIVLNDCDKFFVHVIASSGVNNTLEAIHHKLTKSEAIVYMERVQSFYYAGWVEILGRKS